MTPWSWSGLNHAGAGALISAHLQEGEIAPLGQGDFCLAFRQGEHVIRVARHAEAAAALQREACVIGRIAPMLTLPVPVLTLHTPAGCPPFTVHRYVEGEALTRSVWEGMPPAGRRAAAAGLAGFMRALHSLPASVAEGCGVDRLDGTATAARLRRDIGSSLTGLLDDATFGRLVEALEAWAIPGWERPPALLHADMSPGHVLHDPQTGSLTGIIDFGDIVLGDPARDFIFIHEDFGPHMLEEVLQHYPTPDLEALREGIWRWGLLEAATWTVEMLASGSRDHAESGLAHLTRSVGRKSG